MGKVAAIALIRIYRRWVSPLKPPSCRFIPTCSSYTEEAILLHGVPRGGLIALKRLVRCGPWHPGGFDPVPPKDG